MLIEYQITTTGQCHSLESVPKKAQILCINGKDYIARCENCGKPLVDGDKYFCDPEGVYLCSSCECSLINEEPPQLVTREMALDAGDPSLEGQEI
jgi:hypothetical protein